MKNFWVSWNQRKEYSEFTLDTPWWVSGWSIDDSYSTICAAVRAESEDRAKELVLSAFDQRPIEDRFEWRFVEERPEDWQPFGDRFPRADWMKWPVTSSCSSDTL